jgi:hypothetical protein
MSVDTRPIKYVDVQLCGRLEKTWIHFDLTIIYADGYKDYKKSKCNVYSDPIYPSYRAYWAEAFVKKEKGFAAGYFPKKFSKKKLEEELNHPYAPNVIKIKSVKFFNMPFVCPHSGITWMSKYDYDTECPAHYQFKKLPDDKYKYVVCADQYADAYKLTKEYQRRLANNEIYATI